MREEYPDRIMEGPSSPVESGVGLVAPFADVIEAQFMDKVVDVPVPVHVTRVACWRKFVEIHQVQFWDKVYTPVVAVWCRWPDSGMPQWQFLNVPVFSQRQVPESGTLGALDDSQL